ncbi:hypothetical protein [Actinoplanes sp. M2I2]|uniref:hypothetical protein n=1 Tax=Actinoplanes sp. M2I2 TaxID=1734444 RepID=UPI0035AF22D6
MLQVLGHRHRRAQARRLARVLLVCRARARVRGGGVAGDGGQQFQGKEVVAVVAVPDQLDAPVDLLHGVLVVAGEVTGDADEPRSAPVNLLGGPQRQVFHDKQGELTVVVHQPIEIKKTLADDVLVTRSLVLKYDRRAVLVESERVHAATVPGPGGVLGGQEANPEQRVHVALDQSRAKTAPRASRLTMATQ